MADDNDRYEREQARLRREAVERQKRTDELAEKILAERGEVFQKEAQERGVDDPEKCKAIAEVAADILALSRTTPGTAIHRGDRDLIQDAIAVVDRREKLAVAQVPPSLPELSEAAHQPTANTESQGHVDERAARQGLISSAIELQQNDQTAAEAWVADAEGVERLQHQNGRYNALRNISPSAPPNDFPPHDIPPSTNGLPPNDGPPPPGAVGEKESNLVAPMPAVATAWDAWDTHIEQNEPRAHGGEQDTTYGLLLAMAATPPKEQEGHAEPSTLDLIRDYSGNESSDGHSGLPSEAADDFLAAIEAMPSGEQERSGEPSTLDLIKDYSAEGDMTASSGLMSDFVSEETRQETAEAFTQAVSHHQNTNSGNTM